MRRRHSEATMAEPLTEELLDELLEAPSNDS